MSHGRLRGVEPGPVRTSVEDILAACPSEQARVAMSQAAVVIWAGALIESAGQVEGQAMLRAIADGLAGDPA